MDAGGDDMRGQDLVGGGPGVSVYISALLAPWHSVDGVCKEQRQADG